MISTQLVAAVQGFSILTASIGSRLDYLDFWHFEAKGVRANGKYPLTVVFEKVIS